MVSYVKGILTEILSDTIVIETGGIGINIRIPESAKEGLPAKGSEAKVYTYMYVREDAINLFGFLTRDDLEIFRLLINVSGIGPKGAQSVLSSMTPDELRMAVLTEDIAKISSAPGIGKKTAERAVLELRDKVKTPVFEADEISPKASGKLTEAVEALVTLGIPEKTAATAVASVESAGDMPLEKLVKEALKNV